MKFSEDCKCSNCNSERKGTREERKRWEKEVKWLKKELCQGYHNREQKNKNTTSLLVKCPNKEKELYTYHEAERRCNNCERIDKAFEDVIQKDGRQ